MDCEQAQVFHRKTIEYYQASLALHGPSAEGMNWKNRDSQQLRFEVIAKYIDFSISPTILDVGCGDGEFFQFCQDRGARIHYWGIDVCPEMIAACSKRFGKERFSQRTAIELAGLDERFDYVVASGSFNAKQNFDETTWKRYFHDCMISMFSVCRRATIVNMMSSFVDYRYEHLYYATLAEISELAVTRMSRRFIIDHSYPLYEFTAVFYRE